MVSTNIVKTTESERIERNSAYCEIRISMEHRPYGTEDTRELFAHIPHGQGNITLTRVSTAHKPKTFVISDKELFDLVAQAADYLQWQDGRNAAYEKARALILQWQDGRNAAYEKARALIQENGLDHTLYPQANQEDANLFCILRAKQYLASVPMTNQIHFNELVTATQIAIKQVKAEFAEGKRLAEVELHKLKEAGFQITDLGEDGYDLTHPEFEYDPRLHRDLAEIQDFTPKLLAKLEEIREGRAKKEAAKASIDALKSAGFTIQAVAKELRLKHAEMDDQVFLAKQDLSDVHETAQQALVALQSARDKASVTIEEHKENKHLY